MRFRKMPFEIEAKQVAGNTTTELRHAIIEIAEWCGGKGFGDGVHIETLEGTMKASIGDWVIKGVAGEFYPCKPDIFAANFEPVDD